MTLTADKPVENPDIVEQLLVDDKPIKIRKKRAPKHDFKNGCGRVFAHRHDNGGGWVADTARVNDEVYVGPRCEVFAFACVEGKVKMEGHVKVHGHANICGNRTTTTGVLLQKNAQVYGNAIVRDSVLLSDSARVLGHACVSGTSRIYGTCIVSDSAQVIACTLRDACEIFGAALAIRSHISRTARISGNAVVSHATINGNVRVQDFGQILNSCIDNINSPLLTYVKDHAVVMDSSGVYFPVVFSGHAVIIGSQFPRAYGEQYNIAPEIRDRAIAAWRTFRRVDEIRDYMEQIDSSNGLPRVTPAAASVPSGSSPPANRVNHLETPRAGRRLMSLQGAGT